MRGEEGADEGMEGGRWSEGEEWGEVGKKAFARKSFLGNFG